MGPLGPRRHGTAAGGTAAGGARPRLRYIGWGSPGPPNQLGGPWGPQIYKKYKYLMNFGGPGAPKMHFWGPWAPKNYFLLNIIFLLTFISCY